MRPHRNLIVLAASLFASVGCEEKKPQPPLAPPKPASTTASAPHPQPAAPAAAAAASGKIAALGVSLTLPEAWKQNPPANQMRLAEAEVPDASGEPAKSCLVVFSTAGGSVEDNIARWSGQVRDAAGNAVAPVSEKRTVNGFNITTVAMEGSFVGMGDSAPRSDWRLQGAIVEAPGGLLFIKMTGPVEPMKAASTDFLRMLDSISPH